MAIYRFSHFSFDDSRGSLSSIDTDNDKTHIDKQSANNQTIQLRHKVANLLSYLIINRERIVSKEELLDALWQHGDYRENSLTQSIRELRAALGDKAKTPNYVKTYPQRGYQWIKPLLEAGEDNTQKVAPSVESSTPPLSPSDNQKKQTELGDNTSLVEITSNQAASSNNINSPASLRALLNKKLTLVIIVISICLVGFFIGLSNSQKSSLGEFVKTEFAQESEGSDAAQLSSLLVLPFINATNEPSMAWLELGLADMLAIDLQRHDALANNQLHVTPPAVANALIFNAELQWPALPVHIRSLLREHNISAAIFASVRLHNAQQVLDFQIIYANGKTKQGSISYPSLPAALQSISRQLLHLINPKQHKLIKQVEEDPIASQALAQGMQTLQQEGAWHAKKYFEATLVLDPNNYWALAYSARTSIALGLWQLAENNFNNIPQSVLNMDPSLDAFIHYWRAEIAYRQGQAKLIEKVDKALSKAEAASDAKQMARSYRLKAKIAWQQKAWQNHKEWLKKANSLLGVTDELSTEAEKLFYLGEPSNSGLEKAPENNLQNNQSKLLKALNFYQQLGNQNMVAQSQLAIAQNYTFPIENRSLALQSAIELFTQLQQPYELAQALSYAGFFQMQLHNGAKASQYFSKAKAIAEKLAAQPLIELNDFYLAFAALDQGLDQQALGRHGKNEEKLKQAIELLTHIIDNSSSADLQASALVFLGWANTELGNYDLALTQLSQAKAHNRQLGMQATLAYSSYSMMRIYLEKKDYQAVIAMADENITTRLQATYLARAYYEVGETGKAITVLTNFKLNHHHLWQPTDELRLGLYQSSLSGSKIELADEPKAHLVYCESDWNI
jgi:DNA-binding winged helix-turn-helix (wHTH) protein/tetratricopeptide (TPR) repeat protein